MFALPITWRIKVHKKYKQLHRRIILNVSRCISIIVLFYFTVYEISTRNPVT